MKISIIICVYNEVSTIEKIYSEVLNVKLINNIQKEIIIVDNNSTDGTKEKLKSFRNDNTSIIYQKQNFGKGNSIIEGIKKATGEYVIFQDADLEYSPNNYNKLLEELIINNLDAVFGSRILNNKDYHLYYFNKLAVIIFTKLINLFYSANFTDTATNHKLLKLNVLKSLKPKSKSFALDFEIAIKLAKLKYKYKEIPIDFNPRKYIEGKKIRLIDAFKCLFIIFYYIFRK